MGLNLIEQLACSTIQINATGPSGTCAGTGFVVAFKEADQQHVPVLITNGHVLDGATQASISFSVAKDGMPTKEKYAFSCAISGWCTFHPDFVPGTDTDLCAMPIARLIKQANDNSRDLFYRCIPQSFFAGQSDYDDLFQLDEIAMIGYPRAIMDTVNNQPIFRRGVLATNPSLDYNDQKLFLTDIATIGGSSGSPVFVIQEGSRFERKTHSIVFGAPKCKLLGAHVGGFRFDAEGHVEKWINPTNEALTATTQIPINLGLVIKVERIRELEALF